MLVKFTYYALKFTYYAPIMPNHTWQICHNYEFKTVNLNVQRKCTEREEKKKVYSLN